MGWIYLFIAGCAEIFWAVSLNYLSGPRALYALSGCIIGLGLSIFFMWLAIKTIPLSIAYAIWTGIGIIGVYSFGIFVMHDNIKLLDSIFVLLILFGIVGLKLNTQY